jgi:hypothetical protein
MKNEKYEKNTRLCKVRPKNQRDNTKCEEMMLTLINTLGLYRAYR